MHVPQEKSHVNMQHLFLMTKNDRIQEVNVNIRRNSLLIGFRQRRPVEVYDFDFWHFARLISTLIYYLIAFRFCSQYSALLTSQTSNAFS